VRRSSKNVRRVHDAAGRLGQRGGGAQVGDDAHCDRRRDRQVLGESAGETGDAVLAVELALMRIAARAVLAQWRPRFAYAAPPLIDHHPVAGTQVTHVLSTRLHDARELVSQDLRLVREPDRPPARVPVVVRVSGEDVQVGAAQPDGRDAHEDLPRPGIRAPDIPYLDPADVHQHGSPHGRPPPTCSSNTEAIVLGGTAGSWTTKPESDCSTVSGLPSARRRARSGFSFIPASVSLPSFGQSKTRAYTFPGLAVQRPHAGIPDGLTVVP